MPNRSCVAVVSSAVVMAATLAPWGAAAAVRVTPSPSPSPAPHRGTSNDATLIEIGAALLAGAILLHKHPRPTATPIARQQATPPSQSTPPPQPKPASENPVVAIVGTISEDDAPVAGANIELVARGAPTRRVGMRRVAQAPAGPYSEDLAYVESDRNGRYAIVDQLATGAYALRVSAVGTAVASVALAVSESGQKVVNVALHRSAAAPAQFATRAVYYATERSAVATRGALAFGTDAARPRRLAYGSVDVSLPWSASLPRGYRAATFRDSVGHVAAPRPAANASDPFRALRAESFASASRTVLLFVHGYNQTFEQAARAAAQLRAGLGVDAPAVIYDWPSEGDLTGYAHDEDQAHASATNFVEFVERLARALPGIRIELIAHSMGNRLVTTLVEGGAGAPTGTRVRLDHVVMAAPDVFSSDFFSRLRYILPSAGHFTIYASRSDQALLMSSIVHKDPRLGYFLQTPAVVHGMDTIDATAVDTSILGHGYFVDARSVLSDMRGALADRTPPRPGMQHMKIDATYSYWLLGSP